MIARVVACMIGAAPLCGLAFDRKPLPYHAPVVTVATSAPACHRSTLKSVALRRELHDWETVYCRSTWCFGDALGLKARIAEAERC